MSAMTRTPGQHTAVLNLRLPQAEYDEIKARAAWREQTTAEFVRQALNAVLRALRSQSTDQKEGP